MIVTYWLDRVRRELTELELESLKNMLSETLEIMESQVIFLSLSDQCTAGSFISSMLTQLFFLFFFGYGSEAKLNLKNTPKGKNRQRL